MTLWENIIAWSLVLVLIMFVYSKIKGVSVFEILKNIFNILNYGG